MISKKTHEEWKELVLDFKKSGLTMTRFCKGKDIKPSTFIYWVKKFSPSEIKAPKLVKLPLNNITQSTVPIQVVIDDIKLELPSYIASDKIAKVISAIRELV